VKGGAVREGSNAMNIRVNMTVAVERLIFSEHKFISEDREFTEIKTSSGMSISAGNFCPAGHEIEVIDGVIKLGIRFVDLVHHGSQSMKGAIERVQLVFEQFKGKKVQVLTVDLYVLPSDDDLRILQKAYKNS
jgi:hypothetical protein